MWLLASLQIITTWVVNPLAFRAFWVEIKIVRGHSYNIKWKDTKYAVQQLLEQWKEMGKSEGDKNEKNSNFKMTDCMITFPQVYLGKRNLKELKLIRRKVWKKCMLRS